MQSNNLAKDNMVFTTCNICGSSKYREMMKTALMRAGERKI